MKVGSCIVRGGKSFDKPYTNSLRIIYQKLSFINTGIVKRNPSTYFILTVILKIFGLEKWEEFKILNQVFNFTDNQKRDV